MKKKILGLSKFRFAFVVVFIIVGIVALIIGNGGEKFLTLVPIFFIFYAYSKQAAENDWEEYDNEPDPEKKEKIANRIFINEIRRRGGSLY